mgnify:CR=1 FL=1
MSSVAGRLVGGAMLVGSTAVKAPQIARILRSRSALGIAPSSLRLETLTNASQCAYHSRLGYPLETYGENAALLIQNLVCISLLHRYSPSRGRLSRWARDVAAFACVCAAVSRLHSAAMPLLSLINTPLIIAANCAQIRLNIASGSTGELALLTVLLRWAGALVRVFTTLSQLGADVFVLLNHSLGLLLTSLLLWQFWLFRLHKLPGALE